jgi:hypothetical protein
VLQEQRQPQLARPDAEQGHLVEQRQRERDRRVPLVDQRVRPVVGDDRLVAADRRQVHDGSAQGRSHAGGQDDRRA